MLSIQSHDHKKHLLRATSISKITKSNMFTLFSNNSELYKISFQYRNLKPFRNQNFILSFFVIVTQTNFFLFFNLELVTQSETYYFSTSSY